MRGRPFMQPVLPERYGATSLSGNGWQYIDTGPCTRPCKPSKTERDLRGLTPMFWGNVLLPACSPST